MKLLRKYIRKTLVEGMIPPSSISGKHGIWTNYKDGFLLYNDENIFPRGAQFYFMMLDTNGLLLELEELWSVWNSSTESEEEYDALDEYEKADVYREAVYNHILAMLRVKTKVGSNYGGNCNGAWEVERSAAVMGYGPTLYDLIMSISPGGLVSDRNSVSSDALNYWKISANKRDDIVKTFLDTNSNKFTVSTLDNCDIYSDGNYQDDQALITFASRQLATNFFEETYPYNEIHSAVIKAASMETILNLGNSSGDEYVNLVINTAQNLIDNGRIDIGPLAEEIPNIDSKWLNYKLSNEHDLFQRYISEPVTKKTSILNLSYNTDYAVKDFRKMLKNFQDFETQVRGLLGDEVFTILFLDEMEDTANWYFDDLYYRE